MLYKNKSNFVYVLVHRNIRMYNIYLHAIHLCRHASKTILAVTLFSIILCMRKILVLKNIISVEYNFSYLFKLQTSDNTIVSNEY